MCVCAAGKYMNTMPSEVPAGWDAWCEIRIIYFAMPFYTQHNRFTKTGSGQTYGQHSKRHDAFFLAGWETAEEITSPRRFRSKIWTLWSRRCLRTPSCTAASQVRKTYLFAVRKTHLFVVRKSDQIAKTGLGQASTERCCCYKRKNLVCFWCVSSFAALR